MKRFLAGAAATAALFAGSLVVGTPAARADAACAYDVDTCVYVYDKHACVNAASEELGDPWLCTWW